MNTKQKLTTILIALLAAAITYLICWGFVRNKPCDDNVIKTDTIRTIDTVFKRDTIYKEKIVKKPVPVPYHVSDTQWINGKDSIPITQNFYTNEVLDLWVSGYNVSVDSMKYRETIINDTIIIKETINIEKTKFQKLQFYGELGSGYNFFDKGIMPYAGGGIDYRINKNIAVDCRVDLVGDFKDKKIEPVVSVGLRYVF